MGTVTIKGSGINSAVQAVLDDIRGTGATSARNRRVRVAGYGDSIMAGADCRLPQREGWFSLFTGALKAFGGDGGKFILAYSLDPLAGDVTGDRRAERGQFAEYQNLWGPKYWLAPGWTANVMAAAAPYGVGGHYLQVAGSTPYAWATPTYQYMRMFGNFGGLNGTGTANWTAVIPSVANGHAYRPGNPFGTSGHTEPTWNEFEHETFVDGDCVWMCAGASDGSEATWEPQKKYRANKSNILSDAVVPTTPNGSKYYMIGNRNSFKGTSQNPGPPAWSTGALWAQTNDIGGCIWCFIRNGDAGAVNAWAAATDYRFGDMVKDGAGNVFMLCGALGGIVEPTWPVGSWQTIEDANGATSYATWVECGTYPLTVELPACDQVNLWAWKGLDDNGVLLADMLGTPAGYPYTVNLANTTDAAGPTTCNQIVALPALSDGIAPRFLKLTKSGIDESDVYGFECLRGDVGVIDYNISHSGRAMGDYDTAAAGNATRYAALLGLPAIDPDLYVVCLGVNDLATVTAGTAATRLQTLLGHIRTQTGIAVGNPLPVIFVIPPQIGITLFGGGAVGAAGSNDTFWNSFQLLGNTALAEGCTVVDCSYVFGGLSPTDAQAANYMPTWDDVHPTSTGHGVWAEGLLAALGLDTVDAYAGVMPSLENITDAIDAALDAKLGAGTVDIEDLTQIKQLMAGPKQRHVGTTTQTDEYYATSGDTVPMLVVTRTNANGIVTETPDRDL